MSNRESWLALVTAALGPHFYVEAGARVPSNIRSSCGFPSRSAISGKKRRVGECWSDTASGDKTHEIFVSPTLSDGLIVAGVLAHEIIHATVGLQAKHGAAFKRVALAIGLTGKMTATTAGPKFAEWYAAQNFPEYPHAQLSPTAQRDKQSTRLIKVECESCAAEGEPYIARMSAKTLGMGAPICPIHNESMVASQ